MAECPPKYKNIGSESFGDQKYVTAEMLHQYCMNDEYLYQELLKCIENQMPRTRKRFNQVALDTSHSWGCSLTSDGRVGFDESTSKDIHINFSKAVEGVKFSDSVNYCGLEMIDSIKSDKIDIYSFDNGNGVTKQVVLPTITEKTVEKNSTRNYSPWTIKDGNGNLVSDDMTCNEFWYIGYDKSRHYETRPNWLVNQLNGEITGITRAQTFKCNNSGKLLGVTLNLHGGTNTATPLIVEIRRCEKVNGVWRPVDSDQPHLAYQEVRFDTVDPGVYTVAFEHPPTLEQGKTYAIVLLSPLSHYSNCYSVGGWSKSCQAEIYEDGDAFLSENCGYSWMRYGKDDDVSYHMGQQTPQDFAFQCIIENSQTKYEVNKIHTLYLNPIFSNPVKSVSLSNIDDGDVNNNDYSITYYASNDGRNWIEFDSNMNIQFDEYKPVTFIKAELKTFNENSTPRIEAMNIHLETELPLEAYARTVYYYPPLYGMLSASVWGRVNAPVNISGNASCNVDIIQDKTVKENIEIIEPMSLKRYAFLLDNITLINRILNISNENAMINLLDNNPSLISFLAENQVYIIGYIGKIQMMHSPASPMIYIGLQPLSGSTLDFSEWIDYTVDYSTDEIIFYDDVIETFKEGTLVLKYNPFCIGDLTNSDFYDINGENVGFVLDSYTEDIQITEDDVENGYISLRMTPVDPMRYCIKNPGKSYAEEYKEDVDYYMDYDNKRLYFIYKGENAPIIVGDVIKIKYVPNLSDNGLSLGYHMKRDDFDSKVYVQPYYFEYKS